MPWRPFPLDDQTCSSRAHSVSLSCKYTLNQMFHDWINFSKALYHKFMNKQLSILSQKKKKNNNSWTITMQGLTRVIKFWERFNNSLVISYNILNTSFFHWKIFIQKLRKEMTNENSIQRHSIKMELSIEKDERARYIYTFQNHKKCTVSMYLIDIRT